MASAKSIKVVKMDGKKSGTVKLNADIFDTPSNETLVHDVAVALRAAKRQGNAETKTRREVSGGEQNPSPKRHRSRAAR